MEEIKELWVDPSFAKIIFETIKQWEEDEDAKKEDTPIQVEESLEQEEDEENEKTVYWNSFPNQLKILLKKKFIDPYVTETLKKEDLVEIFLKIGFTKEFVTYYIQENIETDEIDFKDLKYHLGTLISCSHEFMNQRTNE